LASGLYTAATTLTVYTDTSGQAALAVYGSKTGAQVVTAAAGLDCISIPDESGL